MIVLSTLNARYHHSAFGLRYLYANLGQLQSQTKIVEFTTKKNPEEVVREVMALQPRVVGFGVYIWNVKELTAVLKIFKAQHPQVCLVLGGPEVSYEIETQEIFQYCDHIICGEGDFLFRDFCEGFLNGSPAYPKVIKGPRPDISAIQSPYRFYSDEDIKNRVIYVEASRGCPYKCEYCLSSLDEKVRDFEIEAFLQDMELLIQRGARTFKFVDRTFNLSISKSTRILKFFLARMDRGLFVHFELVPDRLPVELRELIRLFPKGSLQFEIGVQTMNPLVARRISRRQNYEKMAENFHFLKTETGVHTHADLIFGLPGESFESFATGFDQLVKFGPDEVQVGHLKRLKGTPIVRHDSDFEVFWSTEPPFEIIQNRDLSAAQMNLLKAFADVWDMYWNAGRFPSFNLWVTEQLAEKEQLSETKHQASLFQWVLEFTKEFLAEFRKTHSISLNDQFQFLQKYLVGVLKRDEEQVRVLLVKDYLRDGRNRLPAFLKGFSAEEAGLSAQRKSHPQDFALGGSLDLSMSSTPQRQRRHALAQDQTDRD